MVGLDLALRHGVEVRSLRIIYSCRSRLPPPGGTTCISGTPPVHSWMDEQALRVDKH